LEQRPQLGHDVFARGRPGLLGVSVEAGSAIDVIEFLWASLARGRGAAGHGDGLSARPAGAARERILRRLNDTPDGAPLDQLLPEESPDTGDVPRRALRRRSRWASTFVAGLVLAKQGDVAIEQQDTFEPIHLTKI
jgi:segregation and condensation protein A